MAADFERDKDIVAYDSFSGLRNDIKPERFGLTDLAVCTNVNMDETGNLSRRDGQTLVHPGVVHSMWAKDNLCLFVEGTSLKQLFTDYTSAVLRSGLTLGAHTSFQQVDGRIFYSNDFETGVIESGTSRSWGLPVPPLPGVSLTVGAMPAGDYQFVLTYVRNDGQESGAGMAGRVTAPAGAGLVFSLPVSTDPAVVAKLLYLTTPNGDVLYRALVLDNAATAATYQNDTLELTLPLATQFLAPPPAGHIVGYYRGHVFVAVQDTLFYSEPNAFELFDLRRYLHFGSRVTMFAPVEDRDNPGVFVGTETGLYWLQGTDPDSISCVQKVDYGVVEGAMTYIDGAMYADHSLGGRMLPMWLSYDGVCLGMPGGNMQNITRSKYRFTAKGSGCALFKPDTTQFVAVANF